MIRTLRVFQGEADGGKENACQHAHTKVSDVILPRISPERP